MSHDTISDFSSAEGDRIDLAGIDANTTAGGNQAFDFIGTQGFHGVAGELRFGPGAGQIYGDVDGDGHADFAIAVPGVASMSADDFML